MRLTISNKIASLHAWKTYTPNENGFREMN